MVWDVVIVGDGPAGLAAGALLTHKGLKVLVLERQQKPGRRALTQEVNGFRLNLGLHSVPNGSSGPLYRILKRIGKLGKVRFVRPELNDSWSVHGVDLYRMILRPSHFVTSKILPPTSKLRLMSLAPKLMTAQKAALWHRSLGGWIDSLTSDEAIRRYLLDQAMIMSFDPQPEEMSAGQFLESFRAISTAGLPFYHVHQGWGAIYEALVEQIEETGGQVRTGSKVQQLAVSEGQVEHVVLDGGDTVRGRAYVLAVPPQEIPNMVTGDAIPPEYVRRMQNLEPIGLETLDLGLTRALQVRTAAFHSSQDRIIVTSYTDPATGLVLPGCQLIQGLYIGLPGELRDPARAEQAHKRLADFIEHYYPGASGNAQVKRSYSFKSAVSVRHKVGQARVDLSGPELPSVKNLFLAGDGTNAPGELGNAAWTSAEIVSEALVRRLQKAGQLG